MNLEPWEPESEIASRFWSPKGGSWSQAFHAWTEETGDVALCDCSVLRRIFWQESRHMLMSHTKVQRYGSFSEGVGPRIIVLESQPGKQSSRSKRSREITTEPIESKLRKHWQQEAIYQKEIVFRFRKDIRQSLRKAGILIFCAWEVPACGGFVQMRCFAPHWSTELPEPTHFEMYLLVLLLFDSALLEGGTSFYRPYRYVQPQRVWEIWCRFWSFSSLTSGYGFLHSSLELGKFLGSYFFHH